MSIVAETSLNWDRRQRNVVAVFTVGENLILTCIALPVSGECFRRLHAILSQIVALCFGFLFHAPRGALGTEFAAGKILSIVSDCVRNETSHCVQFST